MKKVVHLKRALPLICNALNLQKFLNISVEVLPKKAKFQAKNCRNNTCAFSLVEMLMALLVASLLLAALAPVMTKKFSETVNFEGVVPNPGEPTKKVVYLTDPGDGEWDVPNGIRNFTITTVGAGGGGGAGSNYGCVVFTTTATPTGSLLGTDNEYCEHVRNDGNASFTLPDGVNEIYVSLVGGGGGGGAGSAKSDDVKIARWATAGTYTWDVPQVLKGDRVYVVMKGGGGGGGGADQGGGGGGAAGGTNQTTYDIPENKSQIKVIIGGGGKGGYYWTTPGEGGYNGGQKGQLGAGGGGGGACNFDNGAITAFGGGGGAGQCLGAAGWYGQGVWSTVFNYGGAGRTGGNCGPYNGLGGKSGGDGAPGGGWPLGMNGKNGNVGSNGQAMGAARGGGNACGGDTEAGNGGYGVDFDMYSGNSSVGGGAGGGGGGTGWGCSTSAPTGCGAAGQTNPVTIAKAETGAGGAGASCGWNDRGNHTGGEGGDGRIDVRYVLHNYGGAGGMSGPVVPRSRIALSNSMKGGNTITVNLGRGGKGGDRIVITDASTSNANMRTINTTGVLNSSTDLINAKGNAGTVSTVKFGTNVLATTGSGGCGGGYQTTAGGAIGNGTCNPNCGTRHMDGSCSDVNWSFHANQGGSAGNANAGGNSTVLVWDGSNMSNSAGGNSSSWAARNGISGTVGNGGSGSYYGGYGGKGGDGYVKIEWGLARNLDKSEAIRYSGGGGSAGEKITKKIVISPITRKIKYRIGAGGNGGSFNSNTLQMMDGSNGGDTSFGSGSEGFTAVVSKGGRGGKSVRINSTYDSYFMITSLVGNNGNGGIAECNVNNNCIESMNGIDGDHNKGGNGGQSGGVTPEGGNETSINGSDGVNFDGSSGGGNGGGGGISANRNYGKGGKGANGYIKIEYLD